MELSENNFKKFAYSLPEKLKTVKNEIIDSTDYKSLDAKLRHGFHDFTVKWFCESFPKEKDRVGKFIFVEGVNKIDDTFKKVSCGSKIAPDVAFVFGDKFTMAVELEHGKKGSQIRNALAKASFSVLSEAFQESVLIFFTEDNKLGSINYQTDNLVRHFEDKLKTKLYLV